ncbi:autotransporter outer membrane beta-barrel domain-containing protein [Chelatococcus sp. GCM10030263]|uniref:autotransporter family protein n=1 Tax=Chelatococcus sp. GCM10030263 TaxID=3273387 RepID=UPI0036246274
MTYEASSVETSSIARSARRYAGSIEARYRRVLLGATALDAVALLVNASAVPLIAGSVALLASGLPARANDECGAAATVTCGSVGGGTAGDGAPDAGNPYTTGIRYSGAANTSYDVTVLSGVVVQTPTPAGNGIAVLPTGTANASVRTEGSVSITTTPSIGVVGTPTAVGIQVITQNGNGSIYFAGGRIESHLALSAAVQAGFAGSAHIEAAAGSTLVQNPSIAVNYNHPGTSGGRGMIQTWSRGGGDSTVVTAADITTQSYWTRGAMAFAEGGGDAIITMTGGNITTYGNQSFGLETNVYGANGGRAIVNASNGTITTSGLGAYGIWGLADSPTKEANNVSVENMQVVTNGDGAHGIFIFNAGGAIQTDVTVSGGLLQTNGADAHGITYVDAGAGHGDINVNGTVVANGADSSGVYVESSFGATYAVNVASGSVTGGSGEAAAIRANNNGGMPTSGSVNVAAGATLDGTASGIAILDQAGAMSIVTQGTIIGDVVTNEGSDSFTMTAGSLTGSLAMGADADTATFSGVSLATIPVIDGGLGNDTLNLNGITHSGGDDLVQWETVNLAQGTSFNLASDLVTGDAGSGGGLVTIDSTSLLSAFGARQVVGSLANAGTVTMRDGAAGDRLTVVGNYTGANGRLELDTVLGDDSSASDRLVINGGTGTGSTAISVTNVGGTGALTTLDGIKVVDAINGATTAAGSFHLLGDYTTADGRSAVVGGAFAYTLFHNGRSDPQDSDWYLRSQLVPTDPTDPTDPTVPPDPTDPVDPPVPSLPLYQPGVPAYEVYPQLLLGMMRMPSLQERAGNRYWNQLGPAPVEDTVFCKDASRNFRCQLTEDQASYYGSGAGQSVATGKGVWARISGVHSNISPDLSTSFSKYQLNSWELQAGIDGQLVQNQLGALIGGISVHLGTGNADVNSIYGDGGVDATQYGVGASLTWYGNTGFYVDAQGKVSWFSSDLNSDLTGRSLAGGNDAVGYAASLETGKRIDLNDGWSVTPQVQISYRSVDFDTFQDVFGAVVSLQDGESLLGRLGVSLDHEKSWVGAEGQIQRRHLYARANLYNEFEGKTVVDVSGVDFENRSDRLWGGLELGGSYNWNNDMYSVFGAVAANTSLKNFTESYALSGSVGLRVKW